MPITAAFILLFYLLLIQDCLLPEPEDGEGFLPRTRVGFPVISVTSLSQRGVGGKGCPRSEGNFLETDSFFFVEGAKMYLCIVP